MSNRRWEICCHEAGHIVAGKHLLDNEPVAAVLPEVGGVTFLRIRTAPAPTLAGALCIAAGDAAGGLAREHAPPAEAPQPAQVVRRELPPSETAHGELVADFNAGEPDVVHLRNWLGDGLALHLQRSKLARLQNEAADFVREHREEILSVARALYARGLYIPPQRKGCIVTNFAETESVGAAAARRRFVEQVWGGKAAAEVLADLAHAAGMSAAEADKLSADVADAKAHADAAERLDVLRRGAAEAEQELEKVTATQRALIAEAEARIDAAAQAVTVAQRAAQAAEDSARRVVDADGRGLVPDNALPQACVAIMEAQQAEAEKLEWHKRWLVGKEQAAGLRNRVADLRRKAERLQYHREHELTDTGETRDWRWYEAHAKEAEAELCHVEKEIEAAKKAAGIA